jgi:glutaminyl-peptide cyclotransferase
VRISCFLLALVLAFPAANSRAELPVYGCKVLHVYPHDDHAYTEGLFYLDGFLYESTGQVGQSTIRKVRLADGAVLQSQPIPDTMFGEGIVNWKGEIISLTWRHETGFRWDLKTFERRGEFHYEGEGWALTEDGTDIIMSDGTPALRFLDPATMREKWRIAVTADGKPVANLNELEWVKGEIFANIWMTNRIARINPMTGKVIGWIDLSALPETNGSVDRDAVLNGIAYDKEHDRLFVTGKDWPHLYEIRLTPPAAK